MDGQEFSKEDAWRLYVAMLDAAEKRAWSRYAALEVVNEAFARLLAERPWIGDPSKTPAEHAQRLLEEVLSEKRVANRLRFRAETGFQAGHTPEGRDRKSIEAQWIERGEKELATATAKELVGELRHRLREYPLDLEICGLREKGVTKRADLVAKTGRSDYDVKISLARIRRIMESIVAAKSGESKKAAQ